jgi:hypothetical protein
MEKILRCQFNGKDGFKYGDNGICYTYNKNEKSKRRAYFIASEKMRQDEADKENNSEITESHG